MEKEHLEELNKIKNKKNLENIIKDLFNKQKEEFSNEIKIFKKEILSEMKE